MDILNIFLKSHWTEVFVCVGGWDWGDLRFIADVPRIRATEQTNRWKNRTHSQRSLLYRGCAALFYSFALRVVVLLPLVANRP